MRRPASLALCAARPLLFTLTMLVWFPAPVPAQPIGVEEGSGRLLPANVAPPSAAPAFVQPPAAIQNPMPQRIPMVEEPAPPPAQAMNLPVAPQQGAAPPPIVGSPILLVLDFRSATLGREELEALTQALWAQLNVTDAARLLPRNETRQWLIANDLYPYLPYGPYVPMHIVARKAGAHFVVTGTLDRIDESYAIELLVYGAASEAPVHKEAGARVADLNQMLLRMGTVAAEVLEAVGKQVGRPLGPPVPRALPQVSPRPAARQVKPAEETTKVKVAAAVRPLVGSEESIAPPAPKAAAKPLEEPKELVIARAAPPLPEPDDLGNKPAPAATPKPVATPAHTPEPAAARPVPTPQPDAAARAEPLYQEAMRLAIGDDRRLEKLIQAVALEPKNPVYSQQLGFDHYFRKEYEKCVELCDKALALTPGNSQLLLVKGSALISLKRWEEAVKAYEASIAADPANNYARYNLALGLEQMKSPTAAGAWRDYLEQAKTDPDPQHRELMADATARLAKLEPAH